jgi:hypothetical protein
MQVKLAMEVSVIDWSFAFSFPPVMIIGAIAKISGGSANNHRLVERNGQSLSGDGYFELNFVSDHPALTTDNIVVARSAPYMFSPPSGLQGIRVFGENGSKSKELAGADLEDSISALSAFRSKKVVSSGVDFFPWKAVNSAGGGDVFPWAKTLRDDPDLEPKDILKAPVKELLGRACRVYKTGDALTKDYRPDRVNIELDALNMRSIVNIWMG